MEQLKRLIQEAHRRSLWQVLAIYVAASWVVFEIVQTVTEGLGLPKWFPAFAALLLLIGLPIVLATAFVQEGISPTRQHDPTLMPTAEREPEARPVEPKVERKGARRLLTWRNAISGGVLALALWGIVAAGWIFFSDRPTAGSSAAVAVDTGENAVAVLPFRTRGANLALWREGLMDVLSANLDGVGALRSMDTRAVLARWNSRIGDREATTAEALEVAGSLGARWAIHGQAVELGNQVRLDVRAYAPGSTDPITSASAAGHPDSILALIEGLTLELLRGLGEDQGLGSGGRALSGTSLAAVKAFLQGEQLLRRSEYGAAIESFNEALEIDSTFAMAAARLGLAYGWQRWAGDSAAIAATERALRFADRLPERQRGRIEAFRLLEHGSARSIEVARALAARYPIDPEVLYTLGEATFHLGFADLDLSIAERTQPFERAFALDSSLAIALIHPIAEAASLGDLERFDLLARLFLAQDTTSEYGQTYLTLYQLTRGPTADSLQAIERLKRLPDRSLRRFYDSIWRNADWGAAFDDLYREATAAHRPRDARFNAYIFGLSWNRAWRGKGKDARAALEAADRLRPGHPATASFWITYYAHGLGGEAEAARGIEYITQAGLLRQPVWRWLLATYHRAQGNQLALQADIDTLALLADSLMAAGDTIDAERARSYALGLRGELATSEGRYQEAVPLLREAIPLGAGLQMEYVPVQDQKYALAASLIELGQELEALRILETFHGDAYHDVQASLARAEILERRGERERAIQAYSRAATLYADADPDLRGPYETARRALDRLVSEGRT